MVIDTFQVARSFYSVQHYHHCDNSSVETIVCRLQVTCSSSHNGTQFTLDEFALGAFANKPEHAETVLLNSYAMHAYAL